MRPPATRPISSRKSASTPLNRPKKSGSIGVIPFGPAMNPISRPPSSSTHALAEQHLVRQHAPLRRPRRAARRGAEAPREHDADDDAGRFHQRDDQRHVRLARDAGVQQHAGRDREGHDRHRAVVRGDRRAVGARQAAERAQDRVEQQRDRGAQRDRGQRVRQHRQAGLARELDAAFQADGEQQVDRQRLVQRLGQPQVALRELGRDAEDEEQDDRIEHRGQGLRCRDTGRASSRCPSGASATRSSRAPTRA